jgi:5S rRNA maturation endonuclease (ribonuclease M5)
MSEKKVIDWNARSNVWANAVLDQDRLDELLDRLGCDLEHKPGGTVYRGKCPVHDGEDANFQLVTGGHTLPIRWSCYSHRCHEKFKGSFLGLVRGVLTCQNNDKDVGMTGAENFLKQFLGGRPAVVGRKSRPLPVVESKVLSLTRQQVRGQLQIPSPYFVGRGFSPDVLDALDVGYSSKRKRSIIPVYDESGRTCVGHLERSEKPSCVECGRCHRPGNECRYGQNRWRVMTGFPKHLYLYNHAAVVRSDLPFVVVVEGPCDVFRLAEAGYPAVALLGTDLSEAQAEKLVALKKEVVLVFDNDDAGKKAAGTAFGQLRGRGVSAKTWSPPEGYKDIGEVPLHEVSEWWRRKEEAEDELDRILETGRYAPGKGEVSSREPDNPDFRSQPYPIRLGS